ncbi:unnamed protein product, partial [Chrysoparadoxa australica]
RAEKVSSFISQAEAQMKASDFGAALRSIDSGLRMDAGNSDLVRLREKAQPMWEKLEKSRKSGLSSTEMLKEKGDDAYKKAQFEEAIQHYSECLDDLTGKATTYKASPLAIKCYLNRSACYKQISNFDGTIADATAVLDVDPGNVKALMRRAQACEAIEKYRFALQDVRDVLAMPQDKVGQANFTLANGMQHR